MLHSALREHFREVRLYRLAIGRSALGQICILAEGARHNFPPRVTPLARVCDSNHMHERKGMLGGEALDGKLDLAGGRDYRHAKGIVLAKGANMCTWTHQPRASTNLTIDKSTF
jgi:hypothetical protein